MVDFSDALSSAAGVQVQAHWEPIADATDNLHQLTQEQFEKLKTRWPETVNMEWEQALELFNLDASGVRLLPAEFAGRLVLNRTEGVVVEFSLALPSRNSNVDVNAFRAADVAFIPRMELSTLSSGLSTHEITWETAITEEEARKKLATAFYKFAEIEWTPIEDTVELAKGTNRPIHALVLFGTLDDESC